MKDRGRGMGGGEEVTGMRMVMGAVMEYESVSELARVSE